MWNVPSSFLYELHAMLILFLTDLLLLSAFKNELFEQLNN